MSRIRTVKPDLFKHEGLFEAETRYQLPLRFVFIGLFTCCDREGRFRWQPRRLKVDILPYDSVDMSAILDSLAEAGFIMAYKVKEMVYGYIPSWSNHQHINNKECKSKIPDIQLGVVLKPPINLLLSNSEGHASATRSTSVSHATETGIPSVHLAVSGGENDISIEKISQIHQSGYTIATRASREENATFFAFSRHEGKGKGKEYGREYGKEQEWEKEGCGKEKPKRPMSDLVVEIFGCWQRVMDYPKAILDSSRRKCIQAALAMGYDLAALCQAIPGLCFDPLQYGSK